MSWDFSTDDDYQQQLDWVKQFVHDEIEPLDLVLGHPCDVRDPRRNALVRPLQALVKQRKLWACHLGPELGGQGYGQVKLALLNELLGRSQYGPTVFGCQAPDSGNAEILAHYGSPEQKRRWLQPLLDNEIVSCFAVTDPGASPYKTMSMFIVPTSTPGLKILRNSGFPTEKVATHGYLEFDAVRVPADHMLGRRGEAFVVAQVRLGGGRIHHAMRTIGEARRALDMMCERVISRHTQGERLADKQMVQEKLADSWIELEQFRLLVRRTAWLIDKHKDYQKVRKDIAAVKSAMPKVLHDIASRALLLHGSLGISDEMPFANLVMQSYHVGLADGPIEVHKATLAKQMLRDYKPSQSLFPDYHLPIRREQAIEKFRAVLDKIGQ